MDAVDNATGFDHPTRLLHAGLLLLGIGSWLTGEIAESADPEFAGWTGYGIHASLGIALGVVVLLRLGYGMFGPPAMRFTRWVPVTPDRLRVVGADIGQLLRLRVPLHPPHQGLGALVQALGLLLFTWLAFSGIVLFALMAPGSEPAGWLHTVEEGHEAGGELIPVYLALHVGAALAHLLTGHREVWRRMFGRTGTS